jgi:hypothetical protein
MIQLGLPALLCRGINFSSQRFTFINFIYISNKKAAFKAAFVIPLGRKQNLISH